VIFRDWIGYYDRFPEDDKDFRYHATGIDLAISKNNTADLTAMVSAMVYWYGQNIKIYILPHPINLRINFPETVDKAKEISLSLGKGHPTILFIEEVSYQAALIQELLREGFKAVGVKPQGQDKRQRLTLTTPYIKNKNILFPKKGCETLIDQLVNFGYEKHDDLADAFSILIHSIIKINSRPRVVTGDILG